MSNVIYTPKMAAAEANNEMEAEWKSIFEITDPEERSAAITAISDKVKELTDSKLSKHSEAEAKIKAALSETENAFKTKVIEAIKPSVTKAIKEEFIKIANVHGNLRGFSFHMPYEEVSEIAKADNAETGVKVGDKVVTGHRLGDPQVYLVTRITRLKGSGGGGGGKSEMIVSLKDGGETTYESAVAAYRAITGDNEAKNVSRATATAAIKKAGHSVKS